MSEGIRFPVAEMFTSPQGEGAHTGILMRFIRLAGCSVGKPYTSDAKSALGLAVYQERCTDWGGVSFPCDTNYRKSKTLSIEEIIASLPENTNWVCLTGGEPLMHRHISALILALLAAGRRVHIETSGTEFFDYAPFANVSKPWVCISPKQDYLDHMLKAADEVKVLIGEHFNEAEFVAAFIGRGFRRLYVQPIGGEHCLTQANIDRCLALQEKYPEVRLSIQMHKVIGVR